MSGNNNNSSNNEEPQQDAAPAPAPAVYPNVNALTSNLLVNPVQAGNAGVWSRMSQPNLCCKVDSCVLPAEPLCSNACANNKIVNSISRSFLQGPPAQSPNGLVNVDTAGAAGFRL